MAATGLVAKRLDALVGGIEPVERDECLDAVRYRFQDLQRAPSGSVGGTSASACQARARLAERELQKPEHPPIHHREVRPVSAFGAFDSLRDEPPRIVGLSPEGAQTSSTPREMGLGPRIADIVDREGPRLVEIPLRELPVARSPLDFEKAPPARPRSLTLPAPSAFSRTVTNAARAPPGPLRRSILA